MIVKWLNGDRLPTQVCADMRIWAEPQTEWSIFENFHTKIIQFSATLRPIRTQQKK